MAHSEPSGYDAAMTFTCRRQFGAIAIAAFLAAPLATSCSKAPESTKPASAVVPSKPIGYKGRLDMGPKMAYIAVPRTEAALGQLASSLLTDDQKSFSELVQGDKLMLLEAGTRVQIIGRNGKPTKIRILEGDFKGEEGWVASEWIK